VASGAGLRVDVALDAPHRVSALGLSPEQRRHLVEAGPSAWPLVLAVFTGDREPGKPAITGVHELDAEGLHFRPRFPFVPGVIYTARLDLGGAPLLRRFEAPAPPGRAPRVLAVYPSGDVLPENLLRFYLHFSQPMESKGAQRKVRLVDAAGTEVPLAFVDVEHGLWNPSQTRLTVLLHPGRIKRGVAPGERLGPPLRAGGSYRLVVDGALADTAGRPMGSTFERSFRVSAADRRSPARGGLRLDAPRRPGEPLTVRLPEPLDEALLRRLVWVEDAAGGLLDGTVEVRNGETAWSFRPAAPWSPGAYALRVSPALEDRAGNRFDRLFDREVEGNSPEIATEPEALRFEFAVSP
jgi:hypothetical protein